MNLYFFLRKLIRYSLVVFAILILNFCIPRLMPGDPITYLLGEDVYYIAPEQIEELKREYGLDKPWSEQFILYLARLVPGDLGYSFSFGRPIANIVLERIPMTLLITIPSTFFGIVIGAYLGTLAGWRHERASKRVLTNFMLLLYSIPSYWLGMVFLLIFSLHLKLLPVGGAPPLDSDLPTFLGHIVLPIATLTIFTTAYNAVIMRGVTAGISEEGFVLIALSKGLSEIRFLNRHLLKPSLPPLIAISAIEFGFAFSGALLIEIVFSWPGIGLMMWEAVIARDYPLLQALFTISALIVVLANAIADILCILVDPRLRSEQ